MEILYFFICLGAKVSVLGGRKTVPTGQLTWRKTGMELCLNFFFFFFEYHLLTCLASAEAWGWPELCQTNTEVYLIVTCVPFPFLLHPCCHLIPRNYLLSSLLMSGSFGVTWWLFRFTWPLLPSHAPRICIYTYICIYFTCIKYIYIHIYVSIFLCFFACYKTGHKIGTAFNI